MTDRTQTRQGQMARFSVIPVATALAGLILVVALTVRPLPGAARHGLLFPPWVSPADAFSRAAALELPITDIRLGGRLIVLSAPLPTGSGAGGFFRGALVIAPGGAALCIASRPPEEPAS